MSFSNGWGDFEECSVNYGLLDKRDKRDKTQKYSIFIPKINSSPYFHAPIVRIKMGLSNPNLSNRKEERAGEILGRMGLVN